MTTLELGLDLQVAKRDPYAVGYRMSDLFLYVDQFHLDAFGIGPVHVPAFKTSDRYLKCDFHPAAAFYELPPILVPGSAELEDGLQEQHDEPGDVSHVTISGCGCLARALT